MQNLYSTGMVIRTDSYKVSHHKQYPPGTEYVYSYLESRGGQFPETVFFGLQYYLKAYLQRPITEQDINSAERFIVSHIGPNVFNREGWEYILKEHNGFLPVKIRAVPEGTVVPTRNVMMTIENTDPKVPWITNYVETMLLKVWYPITVATLSREIKKLILRYLEETGDPKGIDFKLHDFGYRGVSSEESAAIGGLAHLVNFKGTDTMIALHAALLYYDDIMAGYSIPAAEHSTITAWGELKEYEAYENMIQQFGDGTLYAVVSDSYNIYNACEKIWGEMLKQKVLDAKGTLVIRPDSGIPHEVVRQVIEILGDKFGFTTNEKGFKVLNKVRVIQGDGIDLEEIQRILEALKIRGWSADNVAFGMGGALLQKCNRDTQKFAIKASAIVKNGKHYDVYKSPVTDNSKRSKRGRLKLIKNETGVLETVSVHSMGIDILETVWVDGNLYRDMPLIQVRENAKI